MKPMRNILAAVALVGLALLSLPACAALQITDDLGVVVNFERSPQRIVSLLPSLAETVCELGQCQRLVGVDRYTNWPASVKPLPKVGGGLDPNIEQIVALRPDVVLMATSSRAAERLRALGLKVVALEPKTHADVQRVMLKIGQLLEVPDAQRIWRAIDAGVTAAAQSLPPGPRPLRVYYEVSTGGYAAGMQSFIGELMVRLGVQNIVTPDLGPFPRINPEYVVRANPDLIMIGARNVQGMAQRPGWSGMKALREQRVCIFTEAESDVLVRPGPRMAEAARVMARCIASKGLQ